MKTYTSRLARIIAGLTVFCTMVSFTWAAPAGSLTKAQADALKSAETYLRDYGRMDIGRPLLISLGSGFEFNLTNDANFYFNQFKTNSQGAHASFMQSQLAVQMAIFAQESQLLMQAGDERLKQLRQEQTDFETKRTALIAAAEAQRQADLAAAETNTTDVAKAQARAAAELRYANALPGPTNRPSFFTETFNPTNGAAPALPTPVKSAFTNDKFLPFLSLITNLNSTIASPNRPAIIGAAGDKWTADIFRALGSPDRADDFKVDNAFFGFTTVGVEPGLLTQKDYAAHVSAIATIEYVEARPEVVLRLMASNAVTALTLTERARIAFDYGFLSDESLKRAIIAHGCLPDEALLIALDYWARCQGHTDEEHNRLLSATWDANRREQAQRLIRRVNSLPEQKRQLEFPFLAHLERNTVQSFLAATNSEQDASVKKDYIEQCKLTSNEQRRLAHIEHWLNINTRKEQSSVGVTVIGPLNESENFDLAESTRIQREFALQMSATYAAAGQEAKANFFTSYAKRLEEDVQLRTAWNAVNSFSGSEGSFGFEIGPRPLTAAGVKNKRDRELQRHGFPALLLLQVGRGGADIRINSITNNGKVLVRVLEPAIRITQHRRWQQTSTGFWRGMHPLHYKPASPLENLPLLKTPLYMVRGLNPLSWAHNKDAIPETHTIAGELAELIRMGNQRVNPTDRAKLWASRAKELTDQLVGGISPVNLPVDSVVPIAVKEEAKRPLEIVKIITPTTNTVASGDKVKGDVLLQFNKEISGDVTYLLGIGGGSTNGKAVASGVYVRFSFELNPITATTVLPVGVRIGNTETYATNLLTFQVKGQDPLALKDVLLPREITWAAKGATIEGLLELTQKYDGTNATFDIFPSGLAVFKTNAVGVTTLPFTIEITDTKMPSGGAIAITVQRKKDGKDDGAKQFSKPIPVKDPAQKGAGQGGNTTSLNYQIDAKGDGRVYALTVPKDLDQRFLAAMTEITAKDLTKATTNTIVVPLPVAPKAP